MDLMHGEKMTYIGRGGRRSMTYIGRGGRRSMLLGCV